MNKIRETRESLKLSRKEVTKYTEIPYRTFEDWEAGKNKPPAYVERYVIRDMKELAEEKKKATD